VEPWRIVRIVNTFFDCNTGPSLVVVSGKEQY